MQSDSAPPAGSSSDAAGGAPQDETSRKPATQATVAASLSSFRGLVGATGDSTTGDSAPGRASNAPNDSTVGTSQSVRLDPAQVTGVGQTFGRYQIKKVLGSGSMGSVFLAHDSQLNREVALKVPRLERDTAGELSQRLHREARAAATLNHPNICPIYDVTEQAGSCFIAMGYVAGKPLSAYLAGKKVQPEREVAKVVRKIALALEEAHAQGIVHRDLKPSNIMIDKRGEPIVMDFGVACWFDDKTQTRLTQQGALVGTPAYMSPEQIEGRTKVGPASDIYSLGVVLYEVLTGRCPFEGTVLNVISQVLHEKPPDARKFRRDLSPELVEIVNRAMRKDPAGRFASMRDFAKALTAFLNGVSREETGRTQPPEPEPIEPVGPELERIKHQPLPTALPPRRRVPSKKKRKGWVPVGYGVVAGTALVIVGALIGAFAVGNRGGSQVAAIDQNAGRGAELPSPSGRQVETPTASPAVSAPATTPPPVPQTGTGAGSTQGRPTIARRSSETPNASAVSSGGTAVSATAASAPSGAAASAPSVVSPSQTQPSVAPAPAVNKPAAPQNSPALTGPRNDPTTRPSPDPANSRGPAIASGSSTGTARDAAPQPGPAVLRTDDNSDSPDSNPPPRGTRPRPSGGGPPRGRGDGPIPFDGGPSKGMTIEQYFEKLDRNGDGRLDPSELPLHIINRADTNKDGELTLSELKQAFKKRGRKLFSPPTAAEMRRLPRDGPPPSLGGPGRPDPGGPPAQRNGGL